jgi:hypothetical protein
MLWKTGRRPTSTTTTACWIASPRRSYKIDTTSCKYTKNILRIRVSVYIYIHISYLSIYIYIHIISIYIYTYIYMYIYIHVYIYILSISNKYIYTGLDHLVQRFETDSHWPTGFELEPCPGVPGEDERTEGAEGRGWPMGRCTELVVDDYIISLYNPNYRRCPSFITHIISPYFCWFRLPYMMGFIQVPIVDGYIYIIISPYNPLRFKLITNYYS